MKITVIFILSLLMSGLVFLQPPLAQDPLYHQFADQRGIGFFPNVLNVISNVPYMLIGLAGFWLLVKDRDIAKPGRISAVYNLFFVGVLLVGAGSFYYHLRPDNATLFWDRLPMAVTFMAFFTIVIAEYIDERLALILFPLFLFIGLSSVIYWYWTETLGQGDLRLYLVVQFLPVILIPVILLSYSPRFTRASGYWLILLCYTVAKLFELWDAGLFQLGEVVSGHTLKHLVSALGAWVFLRMLKTRETIPSFDNPRPID